VTEPQTVTFAGLARLLGVKPQAVTALRHAGRLVLTPDGKRVQLDETQQRLRATADPSKAGVVARHAATRQANAGDGEGKPAAFAPLSSDEANTADDEPLASTGYQHWRERNERAKALAGERDNLIAEGKLMDAGEVVAAVAAATTQLRARLEGLPNVLGPQLAAINDEGQARAVLAEAIEHALEETARQFSNLTKQVIA
jgi:hypothetical protein